MHPDTELRFINHEIGFGVFATKFIPRGTIVWALDELDQVLTPAYVRNLDPDRLKLVDHFSYRDSRGCYVLCWDLCRYVNHSFHANCYGTAYDFDIAVRDIAPGQELTNDYGSLNLEEPFECFPEAATDRVCALPDDILVYHQEWDQSILEALHFFDWVEQPLVHIVAPEKIDKIRISVARNQLVDSVLSTYCRR